MISLCHLKHFEEEIPCLDVASAPHVLTHRAGLCFFSCQYVFTANVKHGTLVWQISGLHKGMRFQKAQLLLAFATTEQRDRY